jgi:beta-1,4-mannosyl-glycoprotein beta-1,4-N-acetylglucosaminyltransferase
MIIDTFLFNDEFDMLDIRLDISAQYVDRWVILEGNRTWSGLPKPYHLSDNLDRIARYQDRIHIVRLDIPANLINWECENFSRASVGLGLASCSSDDIVIHGDLDEIINPDAWPEIMAVMDQHQQPVTCAMEMYIYRFDQQADRRWAGCVVSKRAWFEDCQRLYRGANVKRKDRSHCVSMPRTVGWHWTWIGPDARIRTKVQSCIESQFRDPEQVLSAFRDLDTASAINHKCATHTVTTQYPDSVQTVLNRYPQYWTQTLG